MEWGAAAVVAAIMVVIFFWPTRGPVSAPVSRLPVAKPGTTSTASELVIAESLRSKEDVVRATVKLAEILDRDPGNHEAHVELAYCLKELGFPDRAESEFSRALELHPDSAAWIGLGLLALERSDEDEAINAFREALKLDPGSGEAKYQLALAYSESGRTAEATALLQDLLRQEPSHQAAGRLLHQLAP